MDFRPALTGITPDTHDRFDALLFDAGRSVFLMLDAARIVGLAERLDLYGVETECLVRGEQANDIGDHLPWVAKVDRASRLFRDVFSDSAPNGLWNDEPGLFFLTDWDLPKLMRHLRKFHRPVVAPGDERPFLRYWDFDLTRAMLAEGIGHIQSLVDPEVSLVGRIGEDVYLLQRSDQSPLRPGTLTEDEKRKIGLILTTRRRARIADSIAASFPEYVSHLPRKALEREVDDAWSVANAFRLKDGQVRAKFIITAVALAPGLHRQDIIQALFENSEDPDQAFRDLDKILKRRFAALIGDEI